MWEVEAFGDSDGLGCILPSETAIVGFSWDERVDIGGLITCFYPSGLPGSSIGDCPFVVCDAAS